MKHLLLTQSLLAILTCTCVVASPGPTARVTKVAILAPQDRPYPGILTLNVDLSDIDRKIVRVHETLSAVTANTVLLYPEWLPGTHAPQGPIDRFAGLKITSGGAAVAWMRDPIEIYAFRLTSAPNADTINIEFEYLAPTSTKVGPTEIDRDLALLEWNSVVLYPAGYFSRQIPVDATLTLPAGWTFGTALEAQNTQGAVTTFQRVDLERLVDSPVYAGRYGVKLDLDPGAKVPVHLDVFADRSELLAIKPEALAAYRNLVQQAYKLYGSHHYAHYDFLYSLSDQIVQHGLEHHQSSGNGSYPDSFTEWDKTAAGRDLLSHEYTHSWNGKFRRPADLWTPNYNVPMQNSLLWVYEGQTQYWGKVLTARSGLWTKQQALDDLALTAAYNDTLPGRDWRSVRDTTNDEIINPRRPMSWDSWQRFEDYYSEGALVWLEVDTLIRERSGGKRSLDDFAKDFFGIDDGSFTVATYTFDDVVKALNAVEAYDWKSFLHSRIDDVRQTAPLAGLERGGYSLVYTDTPSDLAKADGDKRSEADFWFSLGVTINDKDGTVNAVLWGAPAYRAKLTAGAQILSVNGTAYESGVLKDAILAAKTATAPLELIVKTGNHYRVVHVDYHDGLRYPHLKRTESIPARLDEIYAPRS